jgi:hypothetical protein
MKTRRKRPEIVKTQTVAAAIRRKEWICLIIALLFAFPSSGNAQCEAKNDAFKSGEHVMYELYFNWKFIWKKVGLASLTTNSTPSRPIGSIYWPLAVKRPTSSLRCGIR